MLHRWIWTPIVAFGAVISTHAGEVVINEIQSANESTTTDTDGDTPDWIELRNLGASPAGLSGYGISDNLSDPFKWYLPPFVLQPGGIIVVWASDKDTVYPNGEMHANFKIDSDGEDVFLTVPDGAHTERVPSVPIATNHSYGRSSSDSTAWLFFENPTPGEPNGAEGYLGTLTAPQFSDEPGFATTPFDLSLVSSDSAAIIRYTLDGTIPTEDSPVFTTPLPVVDRTDAAPPHTRIRTTSSAYPWHEPVGDVFNGTVVRAKAYKTGYQPSAVATGTFFVTGMGIDRYSMPVVSLVTSPENLFDPDSGIYVPGTLHGQTGQKLDTNFHQRGDEWERPVHIELFEPDGNRALAQAAGMRINGNYARSYHQKSFRIYARSKYGKTWFKHQLFPNHSTDRFKTFLLRTASSDIYTAMIRDAVIQELSGGMGFTTQRYRPAVVMVNGAYWGVQFILDRYDPDYFALKYDIDPESIDLLEVPDNSLYEVAAGDITHFNEMIAYLRHRDLSQARVFNEVRRRMDVWNFADYCVANIIAGNSDWPQKNVRTWRYHTDVFDESTSTPLDGRWRWLMFDTERGFGLRVLSTPDFNTLGWSIDANIYSDEATLILRKLVENEDFRSYFINSLATYINTTFSRDRMLAVIDSIAGVMQPEMPEHIARWGEPATMEIWKGHLDVMREFARERINHVYAHTVAQFDLPGYTLLSLDIEGSESARGHIRVSGVDIAPNTPGVDESPYPWTGTYFGSVPLELEAIAPPGAILTGWDGVPLADATANPIVLDLTGPVSVTARFAASTSVSTGAVPDQFTLGHARPNPFNPAITIPYSILRESVVRIVVYDIAGRIVRRLAGNVRHSPGRYESVWNGRDEAGRMVASGVYIVRVSVDAGVVSRVCRVTLLR
jgi:hypothetical protein